MGHTPLACTSKAAFSGLSGGLISAAICSRNERGRAEVPHEIRRCLRRRRLMVCGFNQDALERKRGAFTREVTA